MLELFMNKNGNATALLIFVVVSLILIFLVPAPEGFEDEPEESMEEEEESVEEEEEPMEEEAQVEVEEPLAPEAQTNMAPANLTVSEQPSALQATPAAAPIIEVAPQPLMQPNQRRIVGGVPVQENLSMVPISTNQPKPIIAETEDGKKVILMIPASIKNA